MDEPEEDYMTYGRRTGRFVLKGKHIRKYSDGIENFNDYFTTTDEDSSDESRHSNVEDHLNQNRQLRTRNASAQHHEDSPDSSADIDENIALKLGNGLNSAINHKQKRKSSIIELEDKNTALEAYKSSNIKINPQKNGLLNSENESSDHYQDDVSPFSDSEDESEPLKVTKNSDAKIHHSQNRRLTTRNASCEQYRDDSDEEDTGSKEDNATNVEIHQKQNGMSTSKNAFHRDMPELSDSKFYDKKDKSNSRHLMNSTRMPLKSKDLQEMQIFDSLLVSPIIPHVPGKTKSTHGFKNPRNISRTEILDKECITPKNKLPKSASSANKINRQSLVDLQCDGNDANMCETTENRQKNIIRKQQGATKLNISRQNMQNKNISIRSSPRKHENPDKNQERKHGTKKSKTKNVPFGKDIPDDNDNTYSETINESDREFHSLNMSGQNMTNKSILGQHETSSDEEDEMPAVNHKNTVHKNGVSKILKNRSKTQILPKTKLNTSRQSKPNKSIVLDQHETSFDVEDEMPTFPSAHNNVSKTLNNRSDAPISSATKLNISTQNMPNKNISIRSSPRKQKNTDKNQEKKYETEQNKTKNVPFRKDIPIVNNASSDQLNKSSQKMRAKTLKSPTKRVLETTSKVPILSKTELNNNRQHMSNKSILLDQHETYSDVEDEMPTLQPAHKNVSKTLQNRSKALLSSKTKLNTSRQSKPNKSIVLDQHETSFDVEDEMPTFPSAHHNVSKTLKNRSDAPISSATKLNISRQNMQNKNIPIRSSPRKHENPDKNQERKHGTKKCKTKNVPFGKDIPDDNDISSAQLNKNSQKVKAKTLKSPTKKNLKTDIKAKENILNDERVVRHRELSKRLSEDDIRENELHSKRLRKENSLSVSTPTETTLKINSKAKQNLLSEEGVVQRGELLGTSSKTVLKTNSKQKSVSKTMKTRSKVPIPPKTKLNNSRQDMPNKSILLDQHETISDVEDEMPAFPSAHKHDQSPLKKTSLKTKQPTTVKSSKSKRRSESSRLNSETTATVFAGEASSDVDCDAPVASPAKRRRNENLNDDMTRDNSAVMMGDISGKSKQRNRGTTKELSVKSSTPRKKSGKEKKQSKTQCNSQETENTHDLRRSKRTRRSPLKAWCNERVRYRYLYGEIDFVDVVKCEPKKEPESRKRKNNRKNSKLSAQPKPLTVFDSANGGVLSARVFQPEGSTEWLFPPNFTLETSPYLITRIFKSENISFGFLKLKQSAKKPPQQLPHSDACFQVFRGQVKVKIHQAVFCAGPCDSFIVPCANSYSIENISNTTALLSFCIYTGSILADLAV